MFCTARSNRCVVMDFLLLRGLPRCRRGRGGQWRARTTRSSAGSWPTSGTRRCPRPPPDAPPDAADDAMAVRRGPEISGHCHAWRRRIWSQTHQSGAHDAPVDSMNASSMRACGRVRCGDGSAASLAPAVRRSQGVNKKSGTLVARASPSPLRAVAPPLIPSLSSLPFAPSNPILRLPGHEGTPTHGHTHTAAHAVRRSWRPSGCVTVTDSAARGRSSQQTPPSSTPPHPYTRSRFSPPSIPPHAHAGAFSFHMSSSPAPPV